MGEVGWNHIVEGLEQGDSDGYWQRSNPILAALQEDCPRIEEGGFEWERTNPGHPLGAAATFLIWRVLSGRTRTVAMRMKRKEQTCSYSSPKNKLLSFLTAK